MTKRKTRYRHDCPVCKKEGKRRRLECNLTGLIGDLTHWVNCPDHGQQIAHRGIYEGKQNG